MSVYFFETSNKIFESFILIHCHFVQAAFGYAISILFMDIGPTASMTGTADYINFYFHVWCFSLCEIANTFATNFYLSIV